MLNIDSRKCYMYMSPSNFEIPLTFNTYVVLDPNCKPGGAARSASAMTNQRQLRISKISKPGSTMRAASMAKESEPGTCAKDSLTAAWKAAICSCTHCTPALAEPAEQDRVASEAVGCSPLGREASTTHCLLTCGSTLRALRSWPPDYVQRRRPCATSCRPSPHAGRRSLIRSAS